MKHAGPATLETLAPLLARLRALPGVVERTPGCFYRGAKAFLHFHDDASGVHADVRLAPGDGFTRLRAQKPGGARGVAGRGGEGGGGLMALLHASSKSTGPSRRRVLHFLFGPRVLPCGLAWASSADPVRPQQRASAP